MKRRIAVYLGMTILLLALVPGHVLAQEPPLVTTTELVEHSASWDGKTVSFRGEVLEDVLARSDGTWLNLSDGNNSAMGVFIPRTVSMPVISWTEDYRTIGDTVVVTGVFHRACADHQGETDIHATSVVVTAQGSTKDNPIHRDRVVWLIVLGLALVVVMWFYYRKPGEDPGVRGDSQEPPTRH
ncbi:MAG: hypothetical protein ABFD13_02720 [Candidatus Cryosericum sp.]